jgi:DNA-binding beta-propeller fold protein YncE
MTSASVLTFRIAAAAGPGAFAAAASLFAAVVTAALLTAATSSSALAQDDDLVEVPYFEVDPYWPKPLPNHWVLGSAVGVGVDSRDHVYIIHRRNSFNERTEIGAATDPKSSTCCIPAPNILVFDPEGNLTHSFGGPAEGYVWPDSNHGLTLDHKDNVWIGGNGRGDSHILKFTRDGQFLQQIGVPGQETDSNSTEHFGRVAKVSFDPSANEAYVSDGYRNKRVAVLDADTGAFKRYWGAYGNKPSDEDLGRYNPEDPPAQQFRNPIHCAEPSRDGLVYVCDRPNNRIQVFKTDGTFVKEKFVEPLTLGDGSVWDIAFSGDPEQRFIYLADGKNEKVWIIERETMEILSSFGDGGRQPGQFFAVHSIVADSKGNLYTTETYEGKRVQKFVYRGMKKVRRGEDQGTPWGR